MKTLPLTSLLLATLCAPAVSLAGQPSAKARVAFRIGEAAKALGLTRERQVALRAGDNTVEAFKRARASNQPTAIRMDFGTLHHAPGEAPRFEITTGRYQDTGNSVRRAHNLAYEIGPVRVTRYGQEVGTATKHLSSEKPILDALSKP